MNERIKGMIFDLDGTLLDSMWVWTQIDNDFLGKRGFDIPQDYLEAIAPMGARNAAIYTKDRFNLNEEIEDIMDEWFAMAIESYTSKVESKPYVIQYLKQLKNKGIKMAVATSSDRLLIMPALERNDMFQYFDTIVTVNEVSRGKEFPDIYEKAAENMGLRNEECAVFEDILTGIKSAKMGGFYAVGVYDNHSTYEHPKMQELADRFIMDFGELLDEK